MDKDFFYLCLPLCTGGDLMFHLNGSGRTLGYFPWKQAQFYTAEITLGLEHLHSLATPTPRNEPAAHPSASHRRTQPRPAPIGLKKKTRRRRAGSLAWPLCPRVRRARILGLEHHERSSALRSAHLRCSPSLRRLSAASFQAGSG